MNFINFESARDKEKVRAELRNAREQLLEKAKLAAEKRVDRDVERKLRGEDNWILPAIEKKLSKVDKKKKKKKDKDKEKVKNKSKKDKKKKSKKKSSLREEESSDSENDEMYKKKKKKRRFSTESSNSSSSNSSSKSDEQWVEKVNQQPSLSVVRDNWMTGGLLLPTYSKNNEVKKEKQNIDSYDPKKSERELNPYWKDGGSGLPEFQKPSDDEHNFKKSHYTSKTHGSGSWKKKPIISSNNIIPKKEHTCSDQSKSKDNFESAKYNEFANKNDYKNDLSPSASSESDEEKIETNKEPASSFLTDQQMNELGAQMIKAEIMNNQELAKSLKEKLDNARTVRNQIKDGIKQNFKEKTNNISTGKKIKTEDQVMLTRTDNKGGTRPLSKPNDRPIDPWGGRKCKSKKVETHSAGERVRYFADDDRFDIKQMFEREKYETGIDSDLQFAEIAGSHKNPKDDLEDIFEDKARKNISEHKEAEKEKQRAINEHQKLTKSLDNCSKCFDSNKMDKQLMVSMGSTSYLSLPWHEGMQNGQCLIAPIQHVSCSTQLDEDIWLEITEYRKALTRMFASMKKDVIFFETARYLHRRPHMTIHCIASSNFEMAPFYFKKAIQESEYEWSTNKQLITLKDKDVRRAIPRGLPYFWVHFGMDSGFAHVIEDQEQFPSNFAEEIIGGMLHLNPKMWRKPRKEHNSIPKVKQLADWWKPFDFTS